MIACRRGDVILVPFVFSDESGAKRRPALVLSSDKYHRNRQEMIISAITSNTERILYGDFLIREWKKAGLLRASVATGVIRTIKHAMVERKLGRVTPAIMEGINSQLRKALQLP